MVQLHLGTLFLLRMLQNKYKKGGRDLSRPLSLVFFYFRFLVENILPSLVPAPDTGMDSITDLVADKFSLLTDRS